MMTRSSRFPVSSFGDELQGVLRQGANKEVRIKFDTEALCTRFMHRLNALRAAMKREQHPDWEQLYRCGVHKDVTDRRVLILQPRDSEFRQAIQDAGIPLVESPPQVSEYKVDTPEPGPDSGSGSGDPAEDFLATLRDVTTIRK